MTEAGYSSRGRSSLRVVIAGGHGKIARELERLLSGRGDSVAGLIRNTAQAPDLAERPTWLFQSGPCGPRGRGEPTPIPRAVARFCAKIGIAPPVTFGGRRGNRRRSRALFGRGGGNTCSRR